MHLWVLKNEDKNLYMQKHRKQERISNKDIKKFLNAKKWRISERGDTGIARGIINFGKKPKQADKVTSIWGIKDSSELTVRIELKM